MIRGPIIGVVALGMVMATGSFAAGTPALEQVRAVAETASNFDDDAGGNADADDPAIWVHPTRPADSVVVGTLKNGGLTVFDLRGRELQHIATPPDGRFNNVDIAGNLAVVTDRGLDRLRIYAIDPRGARATTVVTDVTTAAPPLVFSADEAEVEDQRTAYGLAVWPDPAGGAPWVVVSRRHETRLGLFRLTPQNSYRPVAFVDLPSSFGSWTPCAEPGEGPQVEGMVVDRTTGVLYAAQEDVGVWRIPLSRKGFGQPALVDRVRGFGQPAVYDESTEECVPTGPPSPEAGKHLTADAEGLTIAYGKHGRTLYASSQGDSAFARYRLDGGFRYVSGFEVIDSPATDGVQHSDGAAVTTTPLGPAFPHGLLVVHDGENTPETPDRTDTNFKLVRLG
ncbi:phytase [Actinophytocola sp.]|uniref:phytase n=1 Tax=Actinophytocola sp. TaxID=1872138 RepID=UPI002ED1F033